MVKLLIITIVAAVLSLVESADKCNENFLIFMLNSVCSLNKRSFSPDGSKIWSALEKNLNDFERKYKEMMASAEEEELLFGKPMYKTKSQERNTMRPRPMHLSIYADMMSRKMSKPSNVNDRPIRKRDSDIESILKKCCYQNCVREDFLNACEKK